MKRPQPQAPNLVKTILKRLERAGFEAYVVGGAVRDMAMGRRPTDWDIATSASADVAASLFPRLTRFSLRHGTVTLVVEGKSYEVSTFRGSAPTIDDDLARRDFTINAMAWKPDAGRLIDPWGGLRDVNLRVVRAVGSPDDRFREDPLRLLRAVRLGCELGFRIHPETRDAMSGTAPMLSTVAKERVRDELLKILASRKPSSGFEEMAGLNLLEEVLPELSEGRGKKCGSQTVFGHTMETVDRVPTTPTLRLAALFHDVAKPGAGEGHPVEGARIAENIMRRLRFSERTIFEVTHLVRHHRDDREDASSRDERAVRRFVSGLGAEFLGSFFSLRRADLESQGKDTRLLSELDESVRAQLRKGFPLKVQDLRVDGRKVMAVCGIERGPAVGRVLDALFEEVLDHPEWNTEEKLVERLREMVRDQ